MARCSSECPKLPLGSLTDAAHQHIARRLCAEKDPPGILPFYLFSSASFADLASSQECGQIRLGGKQC